MRLTQRVKFSQTQRRLEDVKTSDDLSELKAAVVYLSSELLIQKQWHKDTLLDLCGQINNEFNRVRKPLKELSYQADTFLYVEDKP